MAGSPLMIHSSITIDTDDGPREIQLCYGDITSTSNQRCLNDIDEKGDVEGPEGTATGEEPNDVLLISAFQGNVQSKKLHTRSFVIILKLAIDDF